MVGIHTPLTLVVSFQSMGHGGERVKVLFFFFFNGWLRGAPHNRYLMGFRGIKI